MTKKHEALPIDRASRPEDLVAPAPGAIVSRVLAKAAGGSVTLFAFDGNQGLSEHTAPFDALVQLVDGVLDVVIGGHQVHLTAGEIVRMPANIPHALHAPAPCRLLLTMLRDSETEG
jgi:quercetin dioxygenase-like cupin family protein